MIPSFISIRTLRNVTNRIPIFLFRNKTDKAYTLNEDLNEDPDLPTICTNPFEKEKILCVLCKLNIEPDYKNVRLLSQFQSRYTGKILPKQITKLCTYKQKRVEEEVMKAQHAGLMGYMTKEVSYFDDPQLFNHNILTRTQH